MAAPKQTLRIAIVGSGSGGPAAAALLAKQGHAVTLFEQSPVKLPVGAGFLLQPSGMAVLQELGCLESLLPQIARVDKLHCKNLRGSTLLDLPYAKLQNGLFGAGTHRPILLDVLLDECARSGVDVRWGQTVSEYSKDKSQKPVLIFADSTRSKPYDLLILSDGARSRLRPQTSIPYRETQYPWGALWYIGKRSETFDKRTLWQCVDSTHSLAGFLPTGTSDDLLSLFWSIRLDRIDAWKSTSLENWKRDVLRLAPQAETFLEQIDSHHQLQTARYLDVRMKRLHGDRIAIIGDAAHALSPQLGQGVNLALADAAELARCIATYPLSAALPKFSQNRKRQLAFYQFATRWLTPFFQSDYRPLGWIRDLSFPIAGRSAWMNREMVRSMAGLKTGLLTSESLSTVRNPLPD